MLGEFGETWVLDWGLAKNLFAMLDGESSSPTDVSQHDPAQLTTPGGTPGFVAPEQIDGRAGNANDIYALGAILYSLLTGQGPVSDRLKDEWLQRTRDGNYPRPRELNRAIPRALEAICLKARAVKPEDPYATARELSQEVERWFGDEPTKTWLEPFPVRAARWGRRHRTLVVTTSVAAFLFVSLTGAGGWWYQLHRTRQRLAVEQRGQLIEEDLKQGEQALREEDLVRAKQHLERAGGRIDVGAAEPLRKRRAELLEQLEFVGQLERLRERCLVFDGSNQRILPVGTEYMEVFQRHGMRFGDLNPFARSVFGLYSPDFALGDLSDRNSL